MGSGADHDGWGGAFAAALLDLFLDADISGYAGVLGLSPEIVDSPCMTPAILCRCSYKARVNLSLRFSK